MFFSFSFFFLFVYTSWHVGSLFPTGNRTGAPRAGPLGKSLLKSFQCKKFGKKTVSPALKAQHTLKKKPGQGVGGVGINWEIGIDIHTLL